MWRRGARDLKRGQNQIQMFVRCELPSFIRSCTFALYKLQSTLLFPAADQSWSSFSQQRASLLTVSQCESLQIFSFSRYSGSLIIGLCVCLPSMCVCSFVQFISMRVDGKKDFFPPSAISPPAHWVWYSRVKMCRHS